mgnify:CR=1 FL=1
MKENNSVHEMVDVLKRIGPMTENEIHGTIMGESNKKYADMLRRGMRKGLIRRVEMAHNGVNLTRINTKPTKARFIYYATRTPENEFKASEVIVECSSTLDNSWYNESI